MITDISFEFFPPKSQSAVIQLRDAATILAQLRPKFFSVTSGAGGSAQEGSMEIIRMLQRESAVPITPHLSCIGSSCDDIFQTLTTYKTLGLKRLVALRGDLPAGENILSNDLQYATDLVKFIRDKTGDHFHIEVAAYPEVHPQATTAIDDIQNLKRKRQR